MPLLQVKPGAQGQTLLQTPPFPFGGQAATSQHIAFTQSADSQVMEDNVLVFLSRAEQIVY